MAAAHVRPTTGPTAFVDDHVGQAATPERVVLLGQAVAGCRIVRSTHAERATRCSARTPCRSCRRADHRGAHPAYQPRDDAGTQPAGATYLACADALVRMTRVGEYPFASAPTGLRRGCPAGRRRAAPPRCRGPDRLRQPERRLGDPPDGTPGPVSGQSLAAIVTGVLRERQVPTKRCHWSSPVASRGAPRSPRGPRRSRCGRSRSSRPVSGSGRSSSSATSLSCAGGAAADPGGDNPGDPSPGEEQPPVGRGAAAAAEPPDGQPGRAGRA